MRPQSQPPAPSVEPDERETAYRLHRRFDRIGRLVGDAGMERLLGAHVMVVGLGGVGSFAVEALARSGIGTLTLVDFDRVCVTNTNRQLQAVQGAIAKPKAALLAERVRLINPQATARPEAIFYSAKSADTLLAARPDFVVDAIDNVTAKCHLLATCKARQIPVVCSTGASGRMDPTAIAVVDLADTKIDPLADAVRRTLRQKYDFPPRGPFGIAAVYSTEPPAEPQELHYDGGEGFHCVCPGGTNDFHSCEERRVIYGTAGFVTGSFGLACASVVVRALATTPR
jgi:tRNA A37 threonylcarbamoyladenosine dehydratase